MLIYLGSGKRAYGPAPIPLRKRNLWDFLAIIDGVAAPTFPEQVEPTKRYGSRLWVFAPDCIHGWIGEDGEECEVGVFQFPSVPKPLQSIVPEGGWLSVALQPEGIEQIRKFIETGTKQLSSPNPVSQLHFESILSGLSILIMEALEMDQMSPVATQAQHTVGAAIAWYDTNLHQAPTLDDVARNVSTSPAHLRRLFHSSMGMSPKEALDQVRFQKAHDYLRDARRTIEDIAELTGFYSASAFSRAFKLRHGISPNHWREQMFNTLGLNSDVTREAEEAAKACSARRPANKGKAKANQPRRSK